MQDRFKFRVWDIERKCFFNDDEVVIYPNGEDSYFNADYDFTESVVEQCTGLKDKNGKLIYEGDIILVDDDKCPVEWDSENARYNVVGYGEIAYLNYKDIEIIGNIHKNTDLLGEE